jgi:hypothetical protein
MDIDTSFPTKLDTVSDAPEPLRSALAESLPSGETVRLLVHAPAFSTGDEKSPATVLAVTNNGWLVASETEGGGASLEKSDFSGTLSLKLTSILLSGQLRISFAAEDTSHSVTLNFETVGDELYREAIDLMLAGIDPAITAEAEKDRNEASIFEAWPVKFRSEARRYWARGQRLLAAIQWPAIFGGFQRELAPAGALLITEREFVLISEEKRFSAEAPYAEEPKELLPDQETSLTPGTPLETPLLPVIEKAEIDPPKLPEDVDEYGDIITFIPLVRLAGFHVSRQERYGVLALQVHAAHGGEKLEIIFPSDDEKAVSKVMEQVLLAGDSATQTMNENLDRTARFPNSLQ